MNTDLRIIYMGTSGFAVAPMETLIQNGYEISAVVTSPDKPSGRGLKLLHSPVYIYAKEKNLRIFQPENLKDEKFIDELSKINPQLQIVVAFRMLPEKVWKLPEYGTINLHASLLPQYRGAAPIHRAIMAGETKTGVTTFIINENIDTGNILMQQEMPVYPDETAGELHGRLMLAGAELVLKTVNDIKKCCRNEISQKTLISEKTVLKTAPKIFKEDCLIRWNAGIDSVYNHIRGLSPYPAATTELISPESKPYYIKVFSCSKQTEKHSFETGKLFTDGRTHLSIAVTDGFIVLEEIQLMSKKKMLIHEFLRGFPMNEHWSIKLV
ncbi:MAG: methionyl-tRNA formyltransferase [Bacteroidota bacterium]